MARRNLRDYMSFRNMVTPRIIELLFLISIFVSIVSGLYVIFVKNSIVINVNYKTLIGLGLILIGPIISRIYCEVLILFFRMNETLTELKNLESNNAKRLNKIIKRQKSLMSERAL